MVSIEPFGVDKDTQYCTILNVDGNCAETLFLFNVVARCWSSIHCGESSGGGV